MYQLLICQVHEADANIKENTLAHLCMIWSFLGDFSSNDALRSFDNYMKVLGYSGKKERWFMKIFLIGCKLITN